MIALKVKRDLISEKVPKHTYKRVTSNSMCRERHVCRGKGPVNIYWICEEFLTFLTIDVLVAPFPRVTQQWPSTTHIIDNARIPSMHLIAFELRFDDISFSQCGWYAKIAKNKFGFIFWSFLYQMMEAANITSKRLFKFLIWLFTNRVEFRKKTTNKE